MATEASRVWRTCFACSARGTRSNSKPGQCLADLLRSKVMTVEVEDKATQTSMQDELSSRV